MLLGITRHLRGATAPAAVLSAAKQLLSVQAKVCRLAHRRVGGGHDELSHAAGAVLALQRAVALDLLGAAAEYAQQASRKQTGEDKLQPSQAEWMAVFRPVLPLIIALQAASCDGEGFQGLKTAAERLLHAATDHGMAPLCALARACLRSLSS